MATRKKTLAVDEAPTAVEPVPPTPTPPLARTPKSRRRPEAETVAAPAPVAAAPPDPLTTEVPWTASDDPAPVAPADRPAPPVVRILGSEPGPLRRAGPRALPPAPALAPRDRRRLLPLVVLSAVFLGAVVLGLQLASRVLAQPSGPATFSALAIPPALTATPVTAAAPPATATSPRRAAAPTAITAGVGDTPESLAHRLGVAVDQLPPVIYAGQVIVVGPVVTATPAPPLAQGGGPATAAPPSGESAACGACEGGVRYTGPVPDPLKIGYTGKTKAPFVPGYAPPDDVPYTGKTQAPFLPGYAPAFIGPQRPTGPVAP